jgi:hypothetical protein
MRPGRLAIPRTRAAVVLLGLALSGPLSPAFAAADEPGDTVLPRSAAPAEPHARAHVAIATGLALSAGSFVFSAAADHAYERYRNDTDPTRIEKDYGTARRDDRWSAGLLLGGTGALALGVYWRFLRHPNSSRASRLGVAPSITPDHAGLALRVDLP